MNITTQQHAYQEHHRFDLWRQLPGRPFGSAQGCLSTSRRGKRPSYYCKTVLIATRACKVVQLTVEQGATTAGFGTINRKDVEERTAAVRLPLGGIRVAAKLTSY